MTALRACAAALVLVLIAGCGSTNAGRVMVIGETAVTYYDAGTRERAQPIAGPSLLPGPPIDDRLLEGKVAVVHFWGSWCGPCRREQPVFVRVSNKYSESPVQFLGVDSRRDQRAQAIAFWEEYETRYPSIYDPASKIAYRWGVGHNFPTTFIVDKRGDVAAAFNGAVDDEFALVKIIDEELAR